MSNSIHSRKHSEDGEDDRGTYIVFFSSSLQHPLKHQNVVYNNRVRLGAKPDGKIDSTKAFLL